MISWWFRDKTNIKMNNIQMEIDGITIEIVRKPIKNMHLRIYPPDGQVRVSAPLKLSLQLIRKQLEAKREWLHAQRARLQSQPAPVVPSMESGEYHPFLGERYPLIILEGSNKPKILFKDKELILIAKPLSTTLEKETALKKWYQAQMIAVVPDLIEKWQPKMGVNVASWGSRMMKTRWGSCNTRTRRIWLNLSLMQKPIACLEYVLIHEMVHLLEASHNARFYQWMDHFMPDWRTHQKTLQLTTNR